MLEQSKRGLTLTLNNGQHTVDEPTVPLTWKLSQELCQVKPTHLILIVQNDSEMRRDDLGERHLLKVSDLQKYIAFYRGGTHKIGVFLLSPKVDLDRVKKGALDRSKGRRSYNHSFDIDDVVEVVDAYKPDDEDRANTIAPRLDKTDIMSAASFTLEVPYGLFAQVPRKGIKALYWWLVNFRYDHPPIDQCEMRKRAIISMLHPVFWFGLVYRLAVLPVWFLMQLTALTAGRLLLPLLGYRPASLFEDIEELWSRQIVHGEFIFKSFFDDERYALNKYGGESHRVWSSDHAYVRVDHLTSGSTKRMTVTPIAVLAVVFCGWYLFSPSASEQWFLPNGFTYDLAAAALIGINLALVLVRLLKPYHLKSSYKFWGVNDEDPTVSSWSFIPYIWISTISLLCCLGFILYSAGWDTFVDALWMTLVGVVVLGVGAWLIAKLIYWAIAEAGEMKDKRKAMREAAENLGKEAYDQWLALYLAGDKREAKRLMINQQPCDICEDRTLLDRIRLFIARVKPNVCKPYSA